MHTLTVNNGFTASYAEKAIGVDITILHISAKNDVPSKLELTLEWKMPDTIVNVCCSPIGYINRHIRPSWRGFSGSSAPVFSDVGYDDMNI